jgi:hypothetical protein
VNALEEEFLSGEEQETEESGKRVIAGTSYGQV